HSFSDFLEVRGLPAQVRESPFHAIDGPKQIDRCRARFSQKIADSRKLKTELRNSLGRRAKHSESGAHRRGHPDCWRSSNNHLADRFRDVTVVRVGVMNLLRWQTALVQHDHAAI